MIPIRDYNPSGTAPVVTTLLIAVNVMAFAWQAAQPPRDMQAYLAHRGGLVPARLQVALRARDQAQTRLFLRSVFTSMFLHAGLLHLLGNVWFLWIFGDNVEDKLGHFGFLIFYFAAGLAAAAAHVWSNLNSTVPCIGASGAISGVLGAYLVTFPRARIKTLIPLFLFLPIFVLVPAGMFLVLWFLGQFMIVAGNVAWQAHVGGFIAGVVLSFLMPERRGFRVRWRRPVVVTRAP